LSKIVILGAQHDSNLGKRFPECDQPRMLRLQVLLEDYTRGYARTERRLVTYGLADSNQSIQRLGYLPKDAPRWTGRHLAKLRRIEGRLAHLKSNPDIDLERVVIGM
jgi:hypothetical protein